jgi:hypothetical protein
MFECGSCMGASTVRAGAVTIGGTCHIADMCCEHIPESGTISPPCKPDLECIKALRARERELPNVGPATSDPKEIRRALFERRGQPATVAYEYGTCAERHEHHLVGIKGDRVCKR